jgi:hypothetical protein
MLSELKPLMRDTIRHTPAKVFKGSGAASFNDADETAYQARVVRKQRTVLSKSGTIAIAQNQVWIAGNVAIDFSDRIELPDGSMPPILAFEHVPDDTGETFTKVYC